MFTPASEVEWRHPEGDAVNRDSWRGRILIGEPDPSLVRFGGLAVAGELARALDLEGRIECELSRERRARPVKVRRRGASPAQLVLALAECQLAGGSFFRDLEEVRADEAGAFLRIVGETPSAPAALQRAKDFRRVHCQRIERALANAGHELDRRLGRDRSLELATVDLDGHPDRGLRPRQAGRRAQPPGTDVIRAACRVLGADRAGADSGVGLRSAREAHRR